MGHVSAEYRGFSICEKCDIILCQLNSLDECKGKPVGGAREYIDRLKSKGVPPARDAEIERLRAELERYGRCYTSSVLNRKELRTALRQARTDNARLQARVAELEGECEELERVAIEVGNLREANERLRTGWNDASERNIPLHTERIAVKADNTRLREALERIARATNPDVPGAQYHCEVARAALEVKPRNPGEVESGQ